MWGIVGLGWKYSARLVEQACAQGISNRIYRYKHRECDCRTFEQALKHVDAALDTALPLHAGSSVDPYPCGIRRSLQCRFERSRRIARTELASGPSSGLPIRRACVGRGSHERVTGDFWTIRGEAGSFGKLLPEISS